MKDFHRNVFSETSAASSLFSWSLCLNSVVGPDGLAARRLPEGFIIYCCPLDTVRSCNPPALMCNPAPAHSGLWRAERGMEGEGGSEIPHRELRQEQDRGDP